MMDYMLLPLRRYADFQGRSRRMEFWMFILFQFVVNFIFMILMLGLGGAALFAGGGLDGGLAAGGIVLVLYILNLLFGLVLLIPNLAVSVRRLHDTNRTGWWLLAPLGPYLLVLLALFMAAAAPDLAILAGILSMVALLVTFGFALVLLVFYFLDGTPGPNRFGHDPKQRGYEHTFA